MYSSLHNHTSFSLLDGVANPDKWAKIAKQMGFAALGISDHGSISGAVSFWKACKAEGVAPVVGVELYVVEDPQARVKKNEDIDPLIHPATRFHACAFVKDDEGFVQICKLMSLANEQFYRRPIVSFEQLLEGLSGGHVIITSACHYGLIRREMGHVGTIARCAEAFGDDFYLEVHPHDLGDQRMINRKAQELAKRFRIKMVAAGDCHYPTPHLEATQEILLATGRHQTLAQYRENPWFNVHGLYLRTQDDFVRHFRANHDYFSKKEVLRAVEHTQEIVEQCAKLDLSQRPVAMPHVPNAKVVMKQLLSEGLKRHFGGRVPPEYMERLKYEISVISRTGFLDYFLIVRDVVEWSRRHGIMVGPGRGSVGGSVVAWLIGIHKIDPIKFGLFFERFLNPDRVAPPDIDLDFAMDRREEVLEYLRQKYGHDHVANISTFLTMKGRTALKDVLRAYGVPAQKAQRLANEVDDSLGLLDSIRQSDELRYHLPREVAKQALKLEGQVRGAGQHAAGVVVADRPLREIAVLERRSGMTVVNWDMKDAEHLGLLKLDVLGLRTCSVIKDACEMIGMEEDIWEWVQSEEGGALADPRVLREFGEGNTVGVFQFESGGMRSLLKSLAPIRDFGVLADATALFRPGPKDSGLMDTYVNRYQGWEDVSYPHPDVEAALKPTMGVMVYQEQTMAVARDLAGFSLAEADILRKAIGKKNHALMAEIKPKFIEGATKKISQEDAEELWEQLQKYASYSFNKAHATFYTLISYVCMWLKVYHPREFFCALLRHTDYEDKLVAYKREMDRLGVPVYPPSIYASEARATVDGAGVRLGLASIKGVGPAALAAIERAKPFNDFASFLERIERRQCNKTVIKMLIAARAVPDVAPKHIEEFVGGKRIPAELAQKALGPFADIQINPKPFGRSKLKQIRALTNKILKCKKCDICRHTGCSGAVPPTYYPGKSRIMLIAESPGKNEDREKKVLVGDSGRMINQHLAKIGLSRQDMYLTNVYKCRPANNKIGEDPPSTCHAWLKEEISILQPRVVICFGRHAMRFFGLTGSIIEMSGAVAWVDEYNAWVIVCPHPGWVMKGNNAERREVFAKAFNALRNILTKREE